MSSARAARRREANAQPAAAIAKHLAAADLAKLIGKLARSARDRDDALALRQLAVVTAWLNDVSAQTTSAKRRVRELRCADCNGGQIALPGELADLLVRLEQVIT